MTGFRSKSLLMHFQGFGFENTICQKLSIAVTQKHKTGVCIRLQHHTIRFYRDVFCGLCKPARLTRTVQEDV